MTRFLPFPGGPARLPIVAFALSASSFFGGVLVVPFAPALASAQRVTVRRAPDAPEVRRDLERVWVSALPRARSLLSSMNGAVMGIELTTGSLADTLGLDVSSVTPDGPADKAGVVAGSRLQAINGVSLLISADDARDPMTADAGYRLLQRVLRDVDVGDSVTVQLLTNGRVENKRVATTDAASLRGHAVPAMRSFAAVAGRASLGLSVGSAGNARDTLGVFITRVTGGGPADLAGVMEGDRIASINGVDVRVPPEDVADPAAARARVSRFERELRDVEVDDVVLLRVYRDGRYRDVSATAVARSEVNDGVFFEWPARIEMELDRARRAPRP